MKLCNEKPLYLGTDASDVRLKAGHLQARVVLWFPKDEAPDNTVLCSIAFAEQDPDQHTKCTATYKEEH